MKCLGILMHSISSKKCDRAIFRSAWLMAFMVVFGCLSLSLLRDTGLVRLVP